MLAFAFLPIPFLVVYLRLNHLFECLSIPVLCTIGMHEANGEDNGDLVRRSSAGEQPRMGA